MYTNYQQGFGFGPRSPSTGFYSNMLAQRLMPSQAQGGPEPWSQQPTGLQIPQMGMMQTPLHPGMPVGPQMMSQGGMPMQNHLAMRQNFGRPMPFNRQY